jgi:tetratricopeptide (TPR) repeat protein
LTTRFVLFCFLLTLPSAALSQGSCVKSPDLQRLFSQRLWNDVLRVTQRCMPETADADYYRGLAYARMGQWDEARAALAAGEKKFPHDERFPVELAGIAFKQKRFGMAKKELHRALRLDPHDRYAINFLATVYFLEGNQEAALQYWNRIGKPRIDEIRTDPQLRVDPALLDRAFTCVPASVLTLDQYRTTLERLRQLGIFPAFRLDLVPQPGEAGETFNLVLSAVERSGWSGGKAAGLISMLRGLPYQTVYPGSFALTPSAVTIDSLIRWDAQKRRVSASVSAPLAGNPKYRFGFYADGRNENWNVSQTFHRSVPLLQAFNLEKLEVGGAIRSIVSSRWNWAAGLDVSDRRFRNLPAGASAADPTFTNGVAVEARARSDFALLQMPEKRFTLGSSIQGTLGNFYAQGFGRFGMLQGSLGTRWFPMGRGDDYEVTENFYTGKTFGAVPFDDLFILGLERDNNLPLRAHIGTHDGQKGSAPLGRDYLLSNWEIDKNVYSNGWLKLRLAPFADTGRIYGRGDGFGSSRWLWDAGGSVKLSVLGGVSLIFTYGKDLRTGKNAFYFTTASVGSLDFLP